MNEPIFKTIFGSSWYKLPPVMIKHYSNRPFSSDQTIVSGKLDVMCKPPLLWIAPLLKALGQIPPYNETNVPTTVHFLSSPETNAFYFKRIFHFQHKKPYIFHSRMIKSKDNEVWEIMRFGFIWKMAYEWDGATVILTHKGYALKLFGIYIPLPLTFIIGKGYAEETAIDDKTFKMLTHITHPLWGKVYEYKGWFKIEND